ncbi:TPA: hypothetical protein DEO28_03660 [Candidatus Dependentiae bacterium]|nr:MAG: hypothetical protein UR14_C0007G0033 [candidate division TM6 bacterium GW2011_GWE2_31_21]KKP53606.1 MAG: hypothetical protein UR43_C0004G0147 [candidate division TM6 bacterium GW2011_GWF2_33_332]HBS48154.1 hypothetical protein [Candidatus Dependentiae bacterium]HBZ73578.1 hypothetical protein [Candidatus Dependentiae bacterium]
MPHFNPATTSHFTAPPSMPSIPNFTNLPMPSLPSVPSVATPQIPTIPNIAHAHVEAIQNWVHSLEERLEKIEFPQVPEDQRRPVIYPRRPMMGVFIIPSSSASSSYNPEEAEIVYPQYEQTRAAILAEIARLNAQEPVIVQLISQCLEASPIFANRFQEIIRNLSTINDAPVPFLHKIIHYMNDDKTDVLLLCSIIQILKFNNRLDFLQAVNVYKENALFQALRDRKLFILNALLDFHPIFNRDARNCLNQPLIFVAGQAKDVAAVCLLKSRGAFEFVDSRNPSEDPSAIGGEEIEYILHPCAGDCRHCCAMTGYNCERFWCGFADCFCNFLCCKGITCDDDDDDD